MATRRSSSTQRRSLVLGGALVATFLFASCSSDSDAALDTPPVSAPLIERALPADAPSYCDAYSAFVDTPDLNEQQRFDLFVEFLDRFGAEGPVELRDRVSGIADGYRPIVELGLSYLDIDENSMSESALNDVIAFREAKDDISELGGEFDADIAETCLGGFPLLIES